ncbi:MAG: hypothetical protein P8J32_00210 [bacterium]|nr:hypothetical protein [bacterium]
MKVNEMTRKEMESYITEVTNVWNERSNHQWDLDITYVSEYLKN